MKDIIKIKTTCPICHVTSLVEFQTNDSNEGKVFTPGDRISAFEDDVNFVDVDGYCCSTICLEKHEDGTHLKARIRINNGLVTNTITDIRI